MSQIQDRLEAIIDVAKIFLKNMNKYPGLFMVINGTRILSENDSNILAALVSKPMTDADVDSAMAILDKYNSHGLENSP
jgi:hypothetical protein